MAGLYMQSAEGVDNVHGMTVVVCIILQLHVMNMIFFLESTATVLIPNECKGKVQMTEQKSWPCYHDPALTSQKTERSLKFGKQVS